MKTTPISPSDLQRSVIAVPPLARDAQLELNPDANRSLLSYLHAGGVTTALYGGNANLYNIGRAQYEQLLGSLPGWAPDDMWLIPSVGPSYGQMLDQLEIVKDHGYPTAMVLPLVSPATPAGTATGIRRAVDRLGAPIVLYLKWESYLTPDLAAALVDDGAVCAIKYAIVRDDPRQDAYLDRLVEMVPAEIVVSGIGERPAIEHWRRFGLRAFTSGSVCVAPRLSAELLRLLEAKRYEDAETVRQRFLPLEDLRDGVHPIRVLHDAVTSAGIADMGPILPLLSNLDGEERRAVAEAATDLRRQDQEAH